MARNPDLIRAILRQPNDDTVRLVYADWLDENDDPKHAELIRVQCELAKKTCAGKRRKELVKREEDLLADPGFHLAEERPFIYERGFVAERYSLELAGKRVALDAVDPESDLEPLIHELSSANVPVLDRVLHLQLNLSKLRGKGLKWDAPLVIDCLRRVAILDCWYGEADETALKRLEKCPHFENAAQINFDNAVVVPFDAIEQLYLSPALPNITSIHLDGEEWLAEDDSPVEDDHLAEFVARIGASKKAAQLSYLQLNWVIGPKTAQALLDAPHLKPSDQLCLFMHQGLNKAMKAALKKKFGKALRM